MKKHIELIIGLGNPGPQYQANRHNAGAWFIEKLAAKHHTQLKSEKKCFGKIAQITIHNRPCRLFIPDTFMNLSGQAVQAVMHFYKFTIDQILIVHDELDLPVGHIRFKQDGGHGGHNGLRDIIRALHSSEFKRLRIGIDHPGHKNQVSSYVLSNPSEKERDCIDEKLSDIISYLPDLLGGEFEKFMQNLHTQKD